jgi:two-component system CheB/CheR fusion protein
MSSSDSPPDNSPPAAPSPYDATASDGPPLNDHSGAAARGAPAPRSRLSFPVVGIGASAGGLEAIEALTQRLSPDRMAFVVVQHLAPGHTSMLTDIIQRGTTLRVVTVAQGMRIEAGTIYVAPPTVELSLDGDELRVTTITEPRAPRHTVDAFLRSLARAGGPMAIGVVLSGSGSDGTLGLKAIKDEGGITFAQEPSTAQQSSMPQSAIDAGVADVALTPGEIGSELLRLSAHPYVGRPPTVMPVGRSAIVKIFAQLRTAYGVDFGLYKQSTIERRIVRRMALHKLENIEDYLTFLSAEPEEVRNLYNDLLIGVTSFFRDTEPFDALKETVFPRLVDARPVGSPIRLWIAGCATGEEAYSIAIALLEFLGDRAGKYKIQIFATDVDEDALMRARTGLYPQSIELDVSPERLGRFFQRTDKGYQVGRLVRDPIVFSRHNLGQDPPFSRLDLVTCRNVLIYMQQAQQKKVLRVFHYALNPDAYLLLGTSESVGEGSDLFSLLDRKLKVYRKKNIPATATFDYGIAGRVREDGDERDVRLDRGPIASVGQIADRKVIDKYGPPGVIVDERLDVVQFRGRIGQYLEPASGAATLNLLKLVRPELLVALRTVIRKSIADNLPTTSTPVPLRVAQGATRAVAVDVMPLADANGSKCLLVLFNEGVHLLHAGENHPSSAEGGNEVEDTRVLDLERELATNKEYLQSTIEELEAANEELQSSNEELQSSNEELQSTNEELETSKEELQSTNEELATVNDELHNRMTQLSVVNDDLHNVLLNTTSPIVIAGADLRIRRFSTASEKLLSLIPSDVGRPISYLRNVISARNIEEVATEAVSSVSFRERRVRCVDGSWYVMKLVPYVTAEQMIRGLIIEFVKTAPPAATTEGDHLSPFAQNVLSALPHPMFMIDRQLSLMWANRAFFEGYAVEPSALSRPLSEAWGSNTDPPELWLFLEELFSGKPPRDVVIEHPFGRRAERPMRFSGRRVASGDGAPGMAVVVMQDV